MLVNALRKDHAFPDAACMSVRALEIVGLHSFGEAQRLDLAMPDGNLGSGLTILVDPDN
jgi:hypothetical protein